MKEIAVNDIPAVWALLETLTPTAVASSLHVLQQTYEIESKKYDVYWEYSDDNVLPFMIEVEHIA